MAKERNLLRMLTADDTSDVDASVNDGPDAALMLMRTCVHNPCSCCNYNVMLMVQHCHLSDMKLISCVDIWWESVDGPAMNRPSADIDCDAKYPPRRRWLMFVHSRLQEINWTCDQLLLMLLQCHMSLCPFQCPSDLSFALCAASVVRCCVMLFLGFDAFCNVTSQK